MKRHGLGIVATAWLLAGCGGDNVSVRVTSGQPGLDPTCAGATGATHPSKNCAPVPFTLLTPQSGPTPALAVPLQQPLTRFPVPPSFPQSPGLVPTPVTPDTIGIPLDTVADPQGNVLVLDADTAGDITQNARIRRILPDGSQQLLLQLAGVGSWQCIATDAAGNIYVGTNLGILVNSTGTSVASFAYAADPVSMAFDATGNLFVIDAEDTTLKRFSRSGVLEAAWGGIPWSPVAVASDLAGNVYVADANPLITSGQTVANYQIYRLDQSGRWTTVFASLSGQTILGQVTDIAIESNGNIIIATSTGGLHEFSRSGVLLTTLAQPSGLGVAFGLSSGAGSTLNYADRSHGTVNQVAPDGRILVIAK